MASALSVARPGLLPSLARLTRALTLCAGVLLLSACPPGGGDPDGGREPACGDGFLDPGERCDPGIKAGPGICPFRCDDGIACTTDLLVGSADTCDARCEQAPNTKCEDQDGCCPSTCNALTDSDCAPVCGNRAVEPGEVCDGNCPVSCNDGNACTIGTLEGSASACTATCTFDPVTLCQRGDGCCPAGCNAQNDGDCSSTCGNGTIEAGETCDGNCPAQCGDGIACTRDILTGAPETCSVQCSFEQIVTCQSGDGCCAPGCDTSNDSDCAASCGNGIIEEGEACDGNCPSVCVDGNACTTGRLVGSAATCDATCLFDPVTQCASGDGCCPAGCTTATDSDCSATCGNGTVEAGETCDGDCPTGCSDGNACTVDSLTGAASTCSAVCKYQPITQCKGGDGCCPTGCAATTDSDCSATCGNGVLEAGETCDGDCPTSCNDGNACTQDTLTGSAASCSATCSHSPLTVCKGGDGCCPRGCSSQSDSDCSITCGNGVVEPGETCDGNCRTTCDDGNACTNDTLTGSAATCNVACSYTSISACADGDGCCPAGCGASTDNDCSATCGDGRVDPGELCDGNCPSTCNDSNACTIDGSTGSAATCNLVCTHQSITQCAPNDGCCPAGCDATTDRDCSPTCGNGVVEPGETCDGTCPRSCDDADACTIDTLTGSPDTCNVACSHSQISTCRAGDGCCPAGCSFATDSDCSCTPKTCQDLGLACGSASDGCGATLSCGTCGTGQSCVSGQCVDSNGTLGTACGADGDCDSGGCIEPDTWGWTGGYCSASCTTDAICGATGHCAYASTGSGICVRACASAADCRAGYECYDEDGDSRKECMPVGSGAGAVGAPCATYDDCAGGRRGYCATQALGFKGGYCAVHSCSASSPCPSGSHCGFKSASGWGICVDDCSRDADCRADGYLCYDADEAGTNECYPAGTGAGSVGGACGAQWDCGGGRYGYCAAAPTWPGGYCTIECSPAKGTCPAGTDCVVFDPTKPTEAYCLDTCAGASECRTSYQCTDRGGTASKECNPQ